MAAVSGTSSGSLPVMLCNCARPPGYGSSCTRIQSDGKDISCDEQHPAVKVQRHHSQQSSSRRRRARRSRRERRSQRQRLAAAHRSPSARSPAGGRIRSGIHLCGQASQTFRCTRFPMHVCKQLLWHLQAPELEHRHLLLNGLHIAADISRNLTGWHTVFCSVQRLRRRGRIRHG